MNQMFTRVTSQTLDFEIGKEEGIIQSYPSLAKVIWQ